MTIGYTRHAEEHLLSAIRWYNDQAPRLGERFHRAVREHEELLKVFPQQGTKYEGTIRRVKVRSFPYCLLYDARPDLIVVVAIVHVARGPDAWESR
jgi:plasmid stabilization system protein ParE